jgi:hypothetical protein
MIFCKVTIIAGGVRSVSHGFYESTCAATVANMRGVGESIKVEAVCHA